MQDHNSSNGKGRAERRQLQQLVVVMVVAVCPNKRSSHPR